jgi:hypothetical protein
MTLPKEHILSQLKGSAIHNIGTSCVDANTRIGRCARVWREDMRDCGVVVVRLQSEMASCPMGWVMYVCLLTIIWNVGSGMMSACSCVFAHLTGRCTNDVHCLREK